MPGLVAFALQPISQRHINSLPQLSRNADLLDRLSTYRRPHTMSTMNAIHHSDGMTDREAVMDAFIRWTTSSDDGDRELLHSVLTSDVVVDFTKLQAMGVPLGVVEGRNAVIDSVIRTPGRGETTHLVGNFRVQLNGDRAQAECLCTMTHYTRKEPSSPIGQADFAMSHKYRGDLIKSDGHWRFARLQIDLYWTGGLVGAP